MKTFMKNKKVLLSLLVANAALFFGLGALSDSLMQTLQWELVRRAGTERIMQRFCMPITGADAPIGEAYFRGRAESAEEILDLVNRLNTTGNLFDVVP